MKSTQSRSSASALQPQNYADYNMGSAPFPAAAGLPRRLAALFYDGLLLAAVCISATIFALAFKALLLGLPSISADTPALGGLWYQGLLLALWVLFFLAFWLRGGQTPGMRAWRLRLQRPDGAEIRWWQGCLRLLAAPPALLCGGLGYWWALFDRGGRSWPDLLSASIIVFQPPHSSQASRSPKPLSPPPAGF